MEFEDPSVVPMILVSRSHVYGSKSDERYAILTVFVHAVAAVL